MYVIIFDHKRRFYHNVGTFMYGEFLHYKLNKNGEIIRKSSKFENISPSIYLMKDYIFWNKLYDEKRLREDLISFIIKSKKKSQILFPNSRFIVINLSDASENYNDFKDSFKNNNIEFVNVKELTNLDIEDESTMNYHIDKSKHPNERYWDELLPQLIKHLKL